MYEARFTTKQIYDNYAKSVSKPKNANQQAARTMKSAGIGSLGGKTTTASAKSIQDSFKEKRERRRKNKGSTYDEVPQVLTQGIVQKPKAKPVKEKGYEKVIRVFNNAMERFGIFDEPTSTYDTVKPQNVYKSSFFSAPEVTTITLPDMAPTTPSPYRPLPDGPDIRNFGTSIGADPSPEKPDSLKFDIFDILNTKEKVMRGGVPGLMSPPTMDQTKPETPGLTIEDAVNRAILATTKEYVIKPGDNLTKIAKRYGTTVKDLVQINKIKNKNKIYAGESLRVPKDSVKDIKEAVLRISTSGDEDPDKQFYQSGVSLDQREYAPEGEAYIPVGDYAGTPPENIQQTGVGRYDSADDMTELEILARTIEAEASGESKKGKLAVGAVIANRASSMAYGGSIKGAILKQAQFSPWNAYTGYEKGISQAKPMLTEKMAPSEDSYEAAKKILSGEYTDPTKGAVHYLNPRRKKPKWYKGFKEQDRGTIKIGRHEFGNADSNKTYDGKSWVLRRTEKSIKPKIRPLGKS